MSLEDDFHQFAADSREFQGKALARLDNLKEHVESVSRKTEGVREDLASHKENITAHGAGAASKSTARVLSWLGFVVSACALAVSALRIR